MIKYTIGHPAYPPSTGNNFEEVHHVFGVYASLWERGATPEQCAYAVEKLKQGAGMVTITLARSRHVIEVKPFNTRATPTRDTGNEGIEETNKAATMLWHTWRTRR